MLFIFSFPFFIIDLFTLYSLFFNVDSLWIIDELLLLVLNTFSNCIDVLNILLFLLLILIFLFIHSLFKFNIFLLLL